ncbi:hypothetical protein [Neomegalonema sp.]|uniref:hypothetical protein n=1 Tax=Neomegalonema sp. TaxID=2039713 RepID=UPI00262A511B|nr:hypothetical protein [Neomegalonema sp.]MDD2869785.1 hypothetical protein [Neomegalonema sp.]
MSAPRIGWTLNLGHILQLLALLVGGLWFAASVQSDQAVMAYEAAETKRRLAAVETSLTDLAKQNTQLTISVNRLSHVVENRTPPLPSAGGTP